MKMASGRKVSRWSTVASVSLALAAGAAAAQDDAHRAYTLEVYRELVGIRTVHPDGDNTARARAMALRLIRR